MRHRNSRSILAAGFAASFLLVGATAAHAAPAGHLPVLPALPSDCHLTLYSNWASGWCGAGSGQYRTVVRCDQNNWFDYNRYGRWATPGDGGTSAAYCDAEDRAFNPYIEKR